MLNRFLSRLIADESGATAVEYGLLVAVISIVIVGAAIFVGEALQATFQDVADCLNTPNTANCF